MSRTDWKLWLIFLVALFLRVYKLESLPYGFHIDEAKAGWNALSILSTLHDDQGNLLPAYYNSFGDQRPTGIFYAIIPSLLTFGRSILAVRLPAALFGALTVFPIFLLVKQVKLLSLSTAYFSALILALNPWHISVSRATSEVVISLFFTSLALYYCYRQVTSSSVRNVILSLGLFIFSYFFYHSIRVLAPFFVFMIFYYHQNRRLFFTFLFVTLASILVMINPASRGRLSQVSLISDFKVSYEIQKMPSEEGPNHVFAARFFHNKIAAYAKRFLEEYVAYFSPQYLLGNLGRPIRYQTPYFGLVTYLEILFLIVALANLSKYPQTKLLWIMLLVAPLPAALTIEDTPNLHRSMLMVIPFTVLFALGLKIVFSRRLIGSALLFLYFLNIVYFFHQYTVHGVYGLSAYYRNGGNVELSKIILNLKSDYNQIIITNYTDNPYPWLAYFSQYSPGYFNINYRTSKSGTATFENYLFHNQKCPTDLLYSSIPAKNDKILYVNGEGCELDTAKLLTVPRLIKTISRPDNSPAFKIWANQ